MGLTGGISSGGGGGGGATPTLAQVLAAGNTAGSDIDVNGHNLTDGTGTLALAVTLNASGHAINNVGSINGVGPLAITGALADGTYPCGTGSITITNGVITAITP